MSFFVANFTPSAAITINTSIFFCKFVAVLTMCFNFISRANRFAVFYGVYILSDLPEVLGINARPVSTFVVNDQLWV